VSRAPLNKALQRMISFASQSHQFTLRAAALLQRDDAVLLHRLEGDPFWSLPGGRVEAGETAAQAVIRELQEELGETVICERLLWVVENFFNHRGKLHHEIGLYFIAHLQPTSALLAQAGPFPGRECHHNLEFTWFERSLLGNLDLRPSFLVDTLASRELTFKHVVHRDALDDGSDVRSR
jgi:8-oxo-dGTP pyrophosphatase MutT (NUDIX family)